jgi:hypothetical protein
MVYLLSLSQSILLSFLFLVRLTCNSEMTANNCWQYGWQVPSTPPEASPKSLAGGQSRIFEQSVFGLPLGNGLDSISANESYLEELYGYDFGE